VYYVGLLNGMDDKALFSETGNGRDVNRHNYTPEEIQNSLSSDVTKAILGLARLRKHEVFGGSFEFKQLSSNSMSLRWTSDSSALTLEFSFSGGKSP
ncbi:MAG: sucrose phosphorylase, partial [Aquiluna sp.]